MSFLNAGLLAAGLAAISIPVIIHLLMRRRRKPILWGAMRFVLEAYRQTRRRLLLERWLLLAARCLILAFIAVALGRPLLAGGGAASGGGRTLYLLLDNSLASSVSRQGGTGLDRNKEAARAMLSALSEGDRAGLILLGSPPESAVVPPSSGLRAMGDTIDRVTATESAADIGAALRTVADALASEPAGQRSAMVAVLSEFLSGSADTQATLPKLPPGVPVVATTPAGEADNLAVQRIRPLRQVLVPREGAETQTATVTLMRSGPGVQRPAATQVRLRLAEAEAPTEGAATTGTVRWSAGEREASVTLPLETPVRRATRSALVVAEIDADTIAGDNTWRLPLEVRESLRVGLVSDTPGRAGLDLTRAGESVRPVEWLALALRPSDASGVELVDVEAGSIDAARLSGLDAAFITSPQRVTEEGWRRLRALAESGALVVIFPPPDTTVHAWPDAMNRALGLGWHIAREPRELPAGLDRPRLVIGPAPAPGEEADDLLGGLRAEASELVGPVSVARLLPITYEKDEGRTLLALEDGTPILVSGSVRAEAAPGAAAPAAGAPGRGVIAYMATPFEIAWTDLPAKPLIVPLVQELLIQGLGRARPALWTSAGAPVKAPAQTAELRPIIRTGDASSPSIAIDDSGAPVIPMRRAGVWQALDTRAGVRGLITVNADARAGRTDAIEAGAIGAWLRQASAEGTPVAWLTAGDSAAPGAPPGRTAREILTTAGQRSPMGPALLLAAVALALVETLLARMASHSNLRPIGGAGAAGTGGGGEGARG